MPGRRSPRSHQPASGPLGRRWRGGRTAGGRRPPLLGAAGEQERLIIEALADLRDMDVREVMTPRVDVVALTIPVHAEDVARAVRESGHSCFPVVHDDLDDLVGVLFVNDLFRTVGPAPVRTGRRAVHLALPPRDLPSGPPALRRPRVPQRPRRPGRDAPPAARLRRGRRRVRRGGRRADREGPPRAPGRRPPRRVRPGRRRARHRAGRRLAGGWSTAGPASTTSGSSSGSRSPTAST